MDNTPMVKYTATGEWESDLLIKTNTEGFGEFLVDMPESMGGTNQGPMALDYVLVALIGCAGNAFALLSNRMGFKFDRFHGEAEGWRNPRGAMGEVGVCKHFCKVKATFRVETHETQERFEQLCNRIETICPVIALLSDAGVELEVSWKKGH